MKYFDWYNTIKENQYTRVKCQRRNIIDKEATNYYKEIGGVIRTRKSNIHCDKKKEGETKVHNLTIPSDNEDPQLKHVYLITNTGIMKRQIKQWWWTIPPISSKQTTTSHLKPLNT
jgi:hypothetical protein